MKNLRQAKGIELLPVGIYATNARLSIGRVDAQLFKDTVEGILQVNFAHYYDQAFTLKHIAITQGAFPEEEERQLIGYIAYCHQQIHDTDVRTLLLFGAFCILEEISFTRKDGQYLRWDARSDRSQGEIPFNKGRIFTFREAITSKLGQMIADFKGSYIQQTLFTEQILPPTKSKHKLEIHQDSSLEILPHLEKNSIDIVLTSPPYANRYDYTRTYALELIYLGCSDEQVKHLR